MPHTQVFQQNYLVKDSRYAQKTLIYVQRSELFL